jgi:hypothetical protein
MRKELTTITLKILCDKCEREIDDFVHMITWLVDGHVISIKQNTNERMLGEELHFCDKECATDYFRNLIDEL